jgi:acyl-CoA dehydrogenase
VSALLEWLCGEKLPAAPQTLEAWWEATRPVRERFASPIEAAAASGLLADRLGWAFASGYQAALRAMFPGLGLHDAAALCATEATGARPRDIQTVVESGQLTGAKMWTTAAPFARAFFVVARAGTSADGKPQLKIVRVGSEAAGVVVTPMDALPFVPEIPHASVRFEKVAGEVLEGDGYAQYLKPFRTLEDLHVHAALLGYLIGIARRCDWPRPEREGLLALISTCVALSKEPVSAAETHLALAGFLAESKRMLERCAPLFEKLSADERARWERDQPLLQVAERVRKARLEKAWEKLGAP